MEVSKNIQKIVEYGTKAPSGHNTQPWKFKATETEIQIYPDFERALPIVDSDNHALYISLGCAAENAVLAAKKHGYRPTLEMAQQKDGTQNIRIGLKKDVSVEEDALFDYIEKRQSTRNAYTTTKIPTTDLERLISSFDFDGIHIKTFTSKEEISALEPLIIEGSNLQFGNKAFVDELVSWIRFSKKEAEKKRDGIWNASMGMPSAGRFVGNIIMKDFVSAKSEAKRWKKLIAASAGCALFVAEKNDVPHWIRLGRAFQRFGLMATSLNINHAHVNMPCEETEVREKLAIKLNIKSDHPLLLVRFGYSDKMPYSLRRPIASVLEETALP
jgi:hypothetical protein